MLDSHTDETADIIRPQLDSDVEGTNVEFWRSRAAQARTVAEGMLDMIARRTMENIAASYDKLADWVARRIG